MTTTIPERGSEKLREAWKHRALSTEAVESIASSLDESKADVEKVSFSGGDHPSAVTLDLSYDGDGVPWCGNDLQFWLKWHHRFGGTVVTPPRIIINGTPRPDILRMRLTFGDQPVLPEQRGPEISNGF